MKAPDSLCKLVLEKLNGYCKMKPNGMKLKTRLFNVKVDKLILNFVKTFSIF